MNIIKIKQPKNLGIDLDKFIRNVSSKSIEIMKQMFQWNFNQKQTGINLLNDSYFFKKNIIIIIQICFNFSKIQIKENMK